MATIYLYVKQHNVTGLKYFGKTKQNPYLYTGSGTYWKRHLKIHGKQFVDTLKVWSFDTLEECSMFALEFSRVNNVAKSSEWANLCDENGESGGNTGRYPTPNSGKYERTAEIRAKNSQSNKGRAFTDEHKQKLRSNHANVEGSNHPMWGRKRPGRKWYNNGVTQILVEAGTQPDSFLPGMLQSRS